MALAEIKAGPNLRQIHLVALTTSDAEEEIYCAYDQEVSSFISKPVQFGGLVQVKRVLQSYRASCELRGPRFPA